MKRVSKLQIYFEGISVLAINFIIKRGAKPVQIRSGLLIKLMAGTTFSGANVSYPHAPPAVGREGGGTLNGRSRARSRRARRRRDPKRSGSGAKAAGL